MEEYIESKETLNKEMEEIENSAFKNQLEAKVSAELMDQIDFINGEY